MSQTKSKITVEQNRYAGTWDVGWLGEDGAFTPHFCGYATKEEAEAEIPGFYDRLERETKAQLDEIAAREQWQNVQWPNLAHVRREIDKLRRRGDLDRALDASFKLDQLLDMDCHEHITWPLPSRKAIESGRVYGR